MLRPSEPLGVIQCGIASRPGGGEAEKIDGDDGGLVIDDDEEAASGEEGDTAA